MKRLSLPESVLVFPLAFVIVPLTLEEPVRSTAEAAHLGWVGGVRGEPSRGLVVGLDLVGFVPFSRVTLDPGIGFV